MNTDYFSIGASKIRGNSERGAYVLKPETLREACEKSEQCEKCPFPDCCYQKCPFRLMEHELDIADKVRDMHGKGMTDYEIGRKLRISADAVWGLRKVLGLPINAKQKHPQPEIPKEDPCGKCKARKICEVHHCTCPDKVRWESQKQENGTKLRGIQDDVIACYKNGMTNIEVGSRHGVRPETACRWKRKLKEKGLL